MTEPLSDTWNDRDLPNLRRIVDALGKTEMPGWPIEVEELVAEHDLDGDSFARSVQALENGGYLEAEWAQTFGSSELVGISTVTRAAYEATGQWPTSDVGADRLLAALQELADGGRTEEVRSRARRALDALSGAGRDIAIGVASAVLSGQVS